MRLFVLRICFLICPALQEQTAWGHAASGGFRRPVGLV